ncbi:MAG TPA: SDR family NAD(P)-dependent oxidoreductase [Candidatus Binatia bacterium]|jgi:NAD(P)-dependent dehydrogenase (short-subunit alcohol dehydrogenase family)
MTTEDGRRLVGKTALVTGGSRGIGKAIAAAYAREGARVFICGRNETDIECAVAEVRATGGDIHGLAGDIGELNHARRIVGAVLERFGSIDVLVNNASLLGPRVPIADYPYSFWREVMRVNVDGLFLVSQEVLKAMIPRRQGSIINVTSGVGRVGKARWGAYSLSKFALEGFTQMLAEEVKEVGIRVNALNPGATRTSMRAAAYPEEDPLQLPRPEAIVEAFVYLASDESVGVTGKSFDAQDWR